MIHSLMQIVMSVGYSFHTNLFVICVEVSHNELYIISRLCDDAF